MKRWGKVIGVSGRRLGVRVKGGVKVMVSVVDG